MCTYCGISFTKFATSAIYLHGAFMNLVKKAHVAQSFSFSTWVLLLELFALTRRNSQLLLLHHWAFNFFQWSCMKKQTIVTKAYISRDFPFRWIFSCDIKTTTFFLCYLLIGFVQLFRSQLSPLQWDIITKGVQLLVLCLDKANAGVTPPQHTSLSDKTDGTKSTIL